MACAIAVFIGHGAVRMRMRPTFLLRSTLHSAPTTEPGRVMSAVADSWRQEFIEHANGDVNAELVLELTNGRSSSRRYSEKTWAKILDDLTAGAILTLECDVEQDGHSYGLSLESLQEADRSTTERLTLNAFVFTLGVSPVGANARLIDWTCTAAVDVAAEAGSIESPDSGVMAALLAPSSKPLFQAAWGVFVGGEFLTPLGGLNTVIDGWPGAAPVIDLSTDRHPLVLLRISEDPQETVHTNYLKTFEFLKPILPHDTTPRPDPALVRHGAKLAANNVPRSEWPPEVRALFPWGEPSGDNDDAPTEQPERPSDGDLPNDRYRSAPMPEADPAMIATFKWEYNDEQDGEKMGPLIVSHPQRGVLWESSDWMRESDAKALAHQQSWTYDPGL